MTCLALMNKTDSKSLTHSGCTKERTRVSAGCSQDILVGGAIPVAVGSKVWVCGHLLAGIVGSNPAGAWMCFCCECCVLSGRGLCDGLIICPEESYQVWCVRARSQSLNNENAPVH
jgi:hypothetical protein